MFEKPSKTLMIALREFVFRHGIFVEASELDDGLVFTRERKGRSKRFGPRRHFAVFLRRNKCRVRCYTLTCGSDDHERLQVRIDFPEKALLLPAEAAIEYEACGRDVKRYSARFPEDAEVGPALFGYVRSESRLLEKLLGDTAYGDLLRLIRRHRRKSRSRAASRRLKAKRPSRRA
ncbi:MAG: hypothetical protein A3G76_10160 [Acidobacteria bacterium RIFCSPLOWO2_12_FULL_65_11]|nr:MAG: hypothetical protein A3H95_14790 [Acidobacteria bacterium RIFCSPLOWO2_02_FULL_64_15]OFW31645.1 MAG: hypothetical protein A3G76_10160 [Acidobacteria bacterium RIFCSPLOWO2_12_FULL_65_11]